MTALPPDYDDDPERSRSFQIGWQEDVHEPVVRRLVAEGARTVLDLGCGIGRFGDAARGRLSWIGVDRSPRQLSDCRRRPVAHADASALPVRDASVDAVVLRWMLYHLERPADALAEARRVVRPGGLVAVSAASRFNDPELVPDGHPPTSLDAEEAVEIVSSVFEADALEVERWDEAMIELADHAEVRAYARSHLVPLDAVAGVHTPLTLTKRGCLVWARR